MRIETILPVTMMTLSALSGIVYATQGDLKKSVYWLAASAITWSVL